MFNFHRLKIRLVEGFKISRWVLISQRVQMWLYEPKNGLYGQVIVQLGFAIALIIGISSCSTIKYVVPTETKVETVTNYVDSVRVRDSIVVIPIERYMDIVPAYDTLHLETTMAKAEAYVDTNFHILRGSIENKKGFKYEEKKVERLIDKTDTLKVYEEVPVEVEKIVKKTPTWCWWLLTFNVLFVVFAILKVYLR